MEKSSSSTISQINVPIRTRNIRKYYRMIAEVGSGTYGRVYKAECLRSKQYVALKKFESKDEKIKEDGFPITAVREIRLLKQLDHSNVIKLREIVLSKPSERNDYRGSTFLVFDYMDHDFAGLHRNKHEFSLPELKCIMKQILLGVQYLHSKKIIHRDLKIANILYNNQGEVKIADFGLARSLNPANPKYTNKVVTLWYRAPELLLGAKEYTQQIDMWSVGCIFIELSVGENLLRGENDPRQLEKIYELCGGPNTQNWPDVEKLSLWKEHKPKRVYERKLRDVIMEKKKNLDPELMNLLEGIMVLNPKKRMTVQQCLDHPFFSSEPLPLEIQEMPKIKEECHEALLKNHKNRQQIITSQKNTFVQRIAQSPSRNVPAPPIQSNIAASATLSKQHSTSSTHSIPSSNKSALPQTSAHAQTTQNIQQQPSLIGASHFDSRQKNQYFSKPPIQQGYYTFESASSKLQQPPQPQQQKFEKYDKNDKYDKYGGSSEQTNNLSSLLKKQSSSTLTSQFNNNGNPLENSSGHKKRSFAENNDYPSIELHLDNTNKIQDTVSKFNSFQGLASLVQKKGSIDRQNLINSDGSKDRPDEQDEDEEKQLTGKKTQNLSSFVNSAFTYSSSIIDNTQNDELKINLKRTPHPLVDLIVKKKIKEE